MHVEFVFAQLYIFGHAATRFAHKMMLDFVML